MTGAVTGPRVVLVGPMGAGKTTVGRLLAARWSVSFRDTDADVQATVGRSVQQVFAEDGEAAFRALERDAVTAALRDHDGVLALGGGAVLDGSTRAALATYPVVFLRVGVEDTVARVGTGQGRPLLSVPSGSSVRERVEGLLAQRTPTYLEVAAYVVDTGGRTPEQIADRIEELLP